GDGRPPQGRPALQRGRGQAVAVPADPRCRSAVLVALEGAEVDLAVGRAAGVALGSAASLHPRSFPQAVARSLRREQRGGFLVAMVLPHIDYSAANTLLSTYGTSIRR